MWKLTITRQVFKCHDRGCDSIIIEGQLLSQTWRSGEETQVSRKFFLRRQKSMRTIGQIKILNLVDLRL